MRIDTNWQEQGCGQWERTLEFPLTARLHVPGEDGRIWDASVPAGTCWTPVIPRANFLILEQDGTFSLLTPFERRAAFFNWDLERLADRLRVTYRVWLPLASRERETAMPPEWHEQKHLSRDAAIAAYRQWMLEAYPQPERYRPEWTENIPGCIHLQLWAGTGEIDHTYDEFVALLDAMRDAGLPRNTMVYFWGWFAPFDRSYPEYWPAAELGGEKGFLRVIAKAQEHGYRLMAHTNHHGFCDDVSGFEDFAADQTVDRDGNRMGWREKGEPAIEYMRPSSARWRAYHIAKMKRFIDAFPVDGIFWDQYGLLMDDPECNYFEYAHVFSSELQAAIPRTVITSEILSERIYDLPLWQHWGTPWCGLPVREEMPHTDLLGLLFGPLLAGTFGHQGTPGAVPVPNSWPSYYWYIDHYGSDEAIQRAQAWHQSVGAIPSVRVNFRDYGIDPVALSILSKVDAAPSPRTQEGKRGEGAASTGNDNV